MSGRFKKAWRMEVEWEDSKVSLWGWTPVENIVSPAERRKVTHARSIGFVLADDKHGVVLAASVEGANATGVVYIPRSAIRKRRRLR